MKINVVAPEFLVFSNLNPGDIFQFSENRADLRDTYILTDKEEDDMPVVVNLCSGTASVVYEDDFYTLVTVAKECSVKF